MNKDEMHLNPILLHCPVCGKASGIGIPRRLTKKDEGHRAMFDHEPCEICKGFMEQGIVVIGVRDGESGSNPYRTGQFYVVRDSFIERMISDEKIQADILRKRVVFMEESTLRLCGFPEPTEEEQS